MDYKRFLEKHYTHEEAKAEPIMAACELADLLLKEHYPNMDHNVIEDNVIRYNEESQEIFDGFYDRFREVIEAL